MRTLAAALMLGMSLQGTAANADAPPFRTVQEVFASLSSVDMERLESLVTPEFELLEVGELWDLEKTVEVIAPTAGRFERRNFFHLISSEIRGDTAWVSYWNRAIYTTSEEVRERAWLESAVLVRDEKRWKVRMLHSTRLTEGQLPEDVVLDEFIDGQ
ncbi:MAG: nuclear transport factor 2 family protein [Pseudomonadota bacterium]